MSITNKDSRKEVDHFLKKLGEVPPRDESELAIARVLRNLQLQQPPPVSGLDFARIGHASPIRLWMTVALLTLVCFVTIVLPWRYWNALSRTRGESTVSQSKSDNLVPPRLVHRVNPRYTKEARAARIEGQIKIDCVVRKDGTLTVRRIIEGLGYGLDENAIGAVMQWRYEPATNHRQPVDFPLTVTINFSFSN
jgi:TonB family protein